jgi:hypothetical protein
MPRGHIDNLLLMLLLDRIVVKILSTFSHQIRARNDALVIPR